MSGFRQIGVIALAVQAAGCAMSMPASQFYSEFPKATQSTYLSGADARQAVLSGRCITLDFHKYNAPVGLTVKDDLNNGASGVDAIVANDGGNAYRIVNFGWTHLPNEATQLQIEFDSLLCNPEADYTEQVEDQNDIST